LLWHLPHGDFHSPVIDSMCFSWNHLERNSLCMILFTYSSRYSWFPVLFSEMLFIVLITYFDAHVIPDLAMGVLSCWLLCILTCLPFFLFCFVGTGDWTQGFTLARQVLYHLRYNPFALVTFQISISSSSTWQISDHDLPTSTSCITEVTGMSHHA
jgi:hypothetical protein